MKTHNIYRRTFEANRYPKLSSERKQLNLHAQTSEYLPSHKYCVETIENENIFSSFSFVTRKEAQDFVNNSSN